jgi:cyclophilin family peptidyl-prolyl cis-trans isomerase
MFKKRILIAILSAILLSGCSGQGSKIITEENAPAAADTFDQGGVFSRINELRMGKKPVGKSEEKPSPALSQSGQKSTPPPPASQQIELENLMNEYKSALIKTNKGDIKLNFYADKSPLTVNNFLNLAKKGFYNGTKFHRVIKNFMIQGGDPNSKDDNWDDDGAGGPGYKFQDEINDEPLVRGSLAMANSGPNTNGSQFFIVTSTSTPWLDGKHTNFGFVAEGMETVEKIENVAVNKNDHPMEDVIIEEIQLVE